jgi:hypothetical protein
LEGLQHTIWRNEKAFKINQIMPPQQAITPQENRKFDTSLGNWTGDATWLELPKPGYPGVAALTMENPNNEQSMELAYPYVAPVKNKFYTLNFKATAGTPGQLREFTYKLTDGINVFTKTYHIPIAQTDYYVIEDINTPIDWVRENTTLTITGKENPGQHWQLWLDNFSLFLPSILKKDYLPLVGVG